MYVVSSLTERVYVCSSKYSDLVLNLSSVVHQGIPVVQLVTQFSKGLPGIYNRMEVLTYKRSVTQSAAPPTVIHFWNEWFGWPHTFLGLERQELVVVVL